MREESHVVLSNNSISLSSRALSCIISLQIKQLNSQVYELESQLLVYISPSIYKKVKSRYFKGLKSLF